MSPILLLLRAGLPALRGRIAEIGVTHRHLAQQLGMSGAALSLILSGARPLPRDFVQRARRALDTLATAERAATEARDRVLAGTPGGGMSGRCCDCGAALDTPAALAGLLPLVCGAPRPGRGLLRCMRPAGHAGRGGGGVHAAPIHHGTPQARVTTWADGPRARPRRASRRHLEPRV